MPGKTQRLQAAERNEVYMTLRLPADLYDDLCRAAKGRFRPASDEARLAIYNHVIAVNDEKGKAA